jgi:C4-dicarboxylate-specific signal transduction histidine kinase
MSQPLPSSHAVPPTPLERALDQNANVRDTVEQSSAELAVINAVLKQELPGDVKKGDVAQALQKTDDLEHKIQDTAHDLAEVNEVLAQEIDERADLERELAATKAALAREKAKP